LQVSAGSQVKRGDRLGLVSNDFGGTPTTIHLHFEIRQVMRDSNGRLTKTFVPPYASLKDAYLRLLIAGKASIQ
jgi:murein DD-endopeptidase MepM/ murein hydrolase activator NlpD